MFHYEIAVPGVPVPVPVPVPGPPLVATTVVTAVVTVAVLIQASIAADASSPKVAPAAVLIAASDFTSFSALTFICASSSNVFNPAANAAAKSALSF